MHFSERPGIVMQLRNSSMDGDISFGINVEVFDRYGRGHPGRPLLPAFRPQSSAVAGNTMASDNSARVEKDG